MNDNILFIDDEEQLLKIVSNSIRNQGYTVFTANNGMAAREYIKDADIIFLDINMPDISGLKLLDEFVGLYPDKVYIMMTAYDDVTNAVSAIKSGAFNYLVKPTKLVDIIDNIEKAKEYLSLKQEKQTIDEQLNCTEDQLGHCLSPFLKKMFPIIQKTAVSDASILIEGETGTGKSMLANIIHKLSERKNYPFIHINCAAIPENLLESELFGYEKGAFTGANNTTIGKFEAANNGTIFLDELGEISLPLQAKLLQITQDKSFMRLGSSVKRYSNVRIISATNKKLKELVDKKQFRDDLYYRLNIINFELLPLRERKEDIIFLINILLNKYRLKYNKEYKISDTLMERLASHPWYGNIRELENAVERAIILSNGDTLSIHNFILEDTGKTNGNNIVTTNTTLNEKLEEVEKKIIQEALIDSSGNMAKAARILGLSRQNLSYKINKYKLEN